jgi:WD40 repeat protein
VHPGEINSLKVWPKNKRLIATHSDSKKVYIWDVMTQKTVKDKNKMPANAPDLILEGHEDMADYALGWSSEAPIIASGGKDKKILMWNIEVFLQQKGLSDKASDNLAASIKKQTSFARTQR